MRKTQRVRWGSKFGVIMAVAGSAVGLGNFLRFPGQVASNGGGAFMIPYFISLFLLGLPLMWIEWTLGRYGGELGHGTAPGIFGSLWEKNRFIKYFGVIGIFGPLVIFSYYIYIESWTLAYSFFALFGKYTKDMDQASMQAFLRGFQGLEKNIYFDSLNWAYFFFLITFALNIGIVYYGIRRGIERLAKIGMPLLFIFAILLMIRVLSLGTPDPNKPDWNLINGLGFLWNPDFKALLNPRVWLAAAGQIFFTLSVGIGVILTYASYLSKKDDVVLSGLSATSTNELAEVILGGSIVIPAAFVFFGPIQIQTIAKGGIFDLGFVTMPLVLNRVPLSFLFGFIWFFLLFLAGLTSSVSLIQPAVAFLEDEFDIDRKKAVIIFAVVSFILCQPSIFFLRQGVVSELDFWGGTFFLVLFALLETILFGWVFGMKKAWVEIHQGADLNIPKIYKFIMKYVTPLFLIFILGFWFFKEGLPVILMKEISLSHRPFILLTRLILFLIFVIICLSLKFAWRRKRLTLNKLE